MQNSTVVITQTSQFTSTNVSFDAQGVLGVATAGTTSNIDLKLVDDCFIIGGVLRSDVSAFGDSVCLQVVDVDGIFAPAGAVLSQYASNWVMRSDAQEQVDITVESPAKILAGLYLRISYTSTGTSDVRVAGNYILYKALF